MSLIKQLWIAIAIVTLLALGGSIVVSTLSARHYLEQQLHVKNLDNATSLALSLSQMPKDPVTVELQVAAQFDAGHYRLIRLSAPDGQIIVERVFDGDTTGAPAWFARLVPLAPAPGIAQVQDGWRQFGTLMVESHSRYAYAALWDATLGLLGWFAVGGVLTGLLGTLIIRAITRPLLGLVEQAEAIGGRRFVTTPEPGTTEFRSVVRAMNALSARIRAMLAEESSRLEQLRRQTQHDELTGLANRGHFMHLFEAALAREDALAEGSVLLARVANLASLNQRLGREETDGLLRTLARTLEACGAREGNCEAGRTNASDLVLLVSGSGATGPLAERVTAALREAAAKHPAAADIRLVVAATAYTSGELRPTVLARLDGALSAAEQADTDMPCVAPGNAIPLHTDLAGWRAELEAALTTPGVQLGHYPVVDRRGASLHHEAPARLLLGGEWRSAGFFMPWVARVGMQAHLDLAVAEAAAREIALRKMPLGINIAAESLCDAGFRDKLRALLQRQPDEAKQLWLDLPEAAALHHPADFRALCVLLRPLGCKLGIEHVGTRFGQLRDLHELGLDYLKIDASVIRDIDQETGNQNFLRGLCLIAHSIGLMTIAEGVSSQSELAALVEIGLDAATGSAVSPR